MAGPKPLEAHEAKLRDALTVRVVYTDLDGTMLGRGGSFLRDPDGTLDPEPTATLLDALGRGIDVVPSSGRSLRGLLGDARILGLQTVISEMGAVIAYDLGREVVTNLGEYPGGEEPPAAHMERTGAVRALFDAFDGKLEHHTPWSAWRDYTQLFRGLVDTDAANDVLADGGFGWLALHDNGRLHGAYLGLEPGASHAYHLMPRGVDKGSAVALDRERRAYAREETMAIGDAIADLAMADQVGALVLVRDAVEADDALAAAATGIENVYVSARPGNLGWCDALRSVAFAGPS
jgi:predicted mannosyl-3-phosphoglycerate phosphatase (HAD superfamily)